MPLNTTFADELAKLIFWGDPIADLAENDSSSPLTDLYVALHTADPGAGGTQDSNECAYTDYARVAVSRDGYGFAISGGVVSFIDPMIFPVCSAAPDASAPYFSVGVASSGAGKILGRGVLSPALAIIIGQAPRIKTDTAISFKTT